MTTGEVVRRKSSKLAFVAYICALFMTLWAVLLDITTFATNDYTWILIQAMSFAAGAMVLLLIAWRRIPIPGRAIAAVLILVDCWVLWNAGVERLLQW